MRTDGHTPTGDEVLFAGLTRPYRRGTTAPTPAELAAEDERFRATEAAREGAYGVAEDDE